MAVVLEKPTTVAPNEGRGFTAGKCFSYEPCPKSTVDDRAVTVETRGVRYLRADNARTPASACSTRLTVRVACPRLRTRS